MNKFEVGDPFGGTPYNSDYAQSRIDALDVAPNKVEWRALLDEITNLARPPHGMRVTTTARMLAQEKLRMLGGRIRRGRPAEY